MDLSLQQILESVISEVISEETQPQSKDTLYTQKKEVLLVRDNKQVISESALKHTNSDVLTEENRKNILFSSALAAGAGALALRKRIKENK